MVTQDAWRWPQQLRAEPHRTAVPAGRRARPGLGAGEAEGLPGAGGPAEPVLRRGSAAGV